MIVYLARAIQAFVMYCVNGTSRSSLLIESTDSMIIVMYIAGPVIKPCSILQVSLKTFKIELQSKIVVKHTNNFLHPFVLLLI